MFKTICWSLMLVFLASCQKEEIKKVEKVKEKVSDVKRDPKTIRFVTVNWEPYFSENLKNQGPFTEITKKAFEKVGYKITVDFVLWDSAVKMAKEGKFADAVLGAWFNKERTKFFKYTDLALPNALHFMKLKKRDITFKGLDSLLPYSIGTIKGFVYYPEFKNNNSIKKVEVEGSKQYLSMLLNKRVDLVIDEKYVLLKAVNKYFPDRKDEFEIIMPEASPQPLYNMISLKYPNYEQVVSDFNKGLKMLIDDGSFDKILKSHGLK